MISGIVAILATGSSCDNVLNEQSQQHHINSADENAEFAASLLLNISDRELQQNLAAELVSISISDVVVVGSAVYEIEDGNGITTYVAMTQVGDVLRMMFARDADIFFADRSGWLIGEPTRVEMGPVIATLFQQLDMFPCIQFDWPAEELQAYLDWVVGSEPAQLAAPGDCACAPEIDGSVECVYEADMSVNF